MHSPSSPPLSGTNGTRTPGSSSFKPSSIMNRNAAGSSASGGSGSGGDGTKTPRKVQWLDQEQSREGDHLHALDELGLDPSAIDYFTDALERHQSQSQQHQQISPPVVTSASTGSVHLQPPPKTFEPTSDSEMSPDPTTTRNTISNAGQGTRIHYFPPRPTNLPPLATGELTSYQRADGPTYPPTTVSSHSRNISAISSDGGDWPLGLEAAGTYIDKDENAGLPGPSDSQYREAQSIVRAHTRKGRGLFMNLGGLHGLSRSRSRERGSKGKEGVNDEEKDAIPSNPPLAQGGGVLSALLTLYNQEQGLPSGMNTPTTEEPQWIDMARGRTALSQPKTDTSSKATSPSSSKAASPAREQEFLLKRSSSMNSSLNLLGRPKNERSGAGTIASLIASTGNISGVAAPKNATVQPNVKRPGYHLSRYSLESKLPTSRNLQAPLAERPVSANFDLRQSPSNDTLATLIHSGEHHHEKSPSSALASHEKSPSGTMTPSHKSKWSGVLKDFPYAASVMSLGRFSAPNTPSVENDDPFAASSAHAKREKERRKRRKAEIFITRHVAEIIQRQEFILRLARAMMMFGAPSHRLQAQIQATGRVLDVEVSCMYLPDCMLISFDDASTATSSIRFIRQSSSLDLGKLSDAYELYWKVIHDDLAVADASTQLTNLMRRGKVYNVWWTMLIGGMCSSSICTVSFAGSFIDAVAVFPLGAALVGLQVFGAKNELYSNVFEIIIAFLFSFIAALLASTNKLCYSAIASSSVVLILPGFIVLCGSLELMSRSLVSGSVRMFYSVVYSLFLGFGLAMGAEAYQKITGHDIVGITDYTCSVSHDDGAWWRTTPTKWWAFLSVPMFSTFLSLRNYARMPPKKELPLLVGIASVGWVTNYFTSTKFTGQSDISAAVGAFAVGFVANLYARFFSGNAFVIMITGILFQVPSGLGSGGLLAFVSEQTDGSSTSYISGFQTALQLISVAIGLTVGLGLSLLVVHPIPSRKRGGGVFSL